ncbi:unnamed protein product [Acanthoscelides obtectus]|uniref:Cation-transporting P-type ATPase N-terminal domain-containing protein n=1 Tax=Acanthoscelides obtectus TaxID=200917 RepID=A0A9P0LYG6_ACAOB|nr:unnamed protein product [Acanthoscelides obtectus]
MEDAHMKTVEEVHGFFGTDPERGLSIDQVKKYQDKYGPNVYAYSNDLSELPNEVIEYVTKIRTKVATSITLGKRFERGNIASTEKNYGR